MNVSTANLMACSAFALAACLRTPTNPRAPQGEQRGNSAPISRPRQAFAQASPATRLVARCTGQRCDLDLTVNFASPDQPHELLVDACQRRDVACSVHAARLTPEGRRVFAALRDRLEAGAFERVYGCPGCADGPIYGIVLPDSPSGDDTSYHLYDPVRLELLPDSLREAHRVFEQVRQSVIDCVPSSLVEISGSCGAEA